MKNLTFRNSATFEPDFICLLTMLKRELSSSSDSYAASSDSELPRMIAPSTPPQKGRRNALSFEERQRQRELLDLHKKVKERLKAGEAIVTPGIFSKNHIAPDSPLQLTPRSSMKVEIKTELAEVILIDSDSESIQPEPSSFGLMTDTKKQKRSNDVESVKKTRKSLISADSEPSSESLKLESFLYTLCPVKGCGNSSLNRKSFYSHIVTFHSCRFAAYLRDLRMARLRQKSGRFTLCGMSYEKALNFLNFNDSPKSLRISKLSEICGKCDSRLSQALLVSFGTETSSRSDVWSFLAKAVFLANELTDESRIRMAKISGILGAVITEMDGSVKTSLQQIANKDTLSDEVLGRVIDKTIREDISRYPLTDPDMKGSVLENGISACKAFARFLLTLISK